MAKQTTGRTSCSSRFFSTRAKEGGTGLGLASAYGIVKNHDGIITVESAKDKGAIFNIYLPVSEKPVTEELDYPFG